MKLLIKLIGQWLRSSSYYQEIRELSTIGAIIIFGWVIKQYGTAIMGFIFSEKGLLCTASLLASLVLGLTLKIFYRMMAIKYYEKSTEIGLYKFMNKENF